MGPRQLKWEAIETSVESRAVSKVHLLISFQSTKRLGKAS